MNNFESFPKLVVKIGPTPGQEFLIEKDEIVFGREVGVDFVIASPAVSRRHARIFRQAGGYFLEDLGSSNKTFLNGKQISSPQLLHSGDTIGLGQAIQLDFFSSEQSTRLETPPLAQTMMEGLPQPLAETLAGQISAEAILLQPPQLLISLPGEAPRAYDLTQSRISLGRSPGRDILINSPIVSAHHADLVKDDQGYRLVLQPQTTNPVYLRGVPLVGEARLQDGDVLRIGSQDPGVIVTMLYQWPAQAALQPEAKSIDFSQQERIQIGRDPAIQCG